MNWEQKRRYLMSGWKFCPEFTEGMEQVPFDGDIVEEVEIPHTCKEVPFHYFDESLYQMVCGYQKAIYIESEWSDKVLLLTFEAVGHQADVYINGKHLYTHRNGYTAFTIDISDAVNYGEDNLVTVKVDSRESLNQPPFGFVIDYMTFGGIYRDVYLDIKHPIHFQNVYLKPSFIEPVDTKGMNRTEIEDLRVTGNLESEFAFSDQAMQVMGEGWMSIRQTVLDEKHQEIAVLEGKYPESSKIRTEIPNVKIWDIESPELYRVKTELFVEYEKVDEVITTIGFRKAEFRKEGFYLNGRKVKIRGLNRHQSYAYVGYAMPESMQRYDARLLKYELGVNAVRTSHYPQSHYFIDECDRLGLLVFTELPGWQHIGDEFWQDIAVENVKEMVIQYRNHPSIIIWGVRINESEDLDAFYERTNRAAHELDATRQTGGVRAHKKGSLLEDVYTYNDFVHDGKNQGCEPKKKVTSDINKPYLITEYNGHMYPTKTFDAEEHRMEHMIRHANVLDAVAGESDIAGSFGWCMFDYNTHKDFGSGDRICYHGVMDMFRNPKFAASVYAAQEEEQPVLEVSSSMDIGEHPACNRGDTYIVTNAEKVRMYKNHDLIREYIASDSEYRNLKHGPIRIDDYVGMAIEKGEKFGKRQAELVKYCLNSVALHGMKVTPGLIGAALKLIVFYHMNPNDAVGLYNKYVGDWGGSSNQYRFEAVKDEKVVKTIVKAPMTKCSLEVNCSSTELREGITYDVAELRVRAVDENGNTLTFFQEGINVVCEGPIRMIGPKQIPLRGGMTGIYVRTTGEKGEARIRISCPGCKTVIQSLRVL